MSIYKQETMSNKINDMNQSKVPVIVFDKELEKLQGKVLFSEKLEKANRILNEVGLPKAK